MLRFSGILVIKKGLKDKMRMVYESERPIRKRLGRSGVPIA